MKDESIITERSKSPVRHHQLSIAIEQKLDFGNSPPPQLSNGTNTLA